MSKSDLKKYANQLTKSQLEAQLLVLYDKFSAVKVYYDFVFNPNEKKLATEARAKIANEYFPVSTRKPKLRRSTAQKIIKHYLSLGVDPFVLADIMLFSIEIAQTYAAEKPPKQAAFYTSTFVSYQQGVKFIQLNGMMYEFQDRISEITREVLAQKWPNASAFNQFFSEID